MTRGAIPAEFTELLAASLLFWLDSAEPGARAPAARRARLEAAIDAAGYKAQDWPALARELYDRADASLNARSGSRLDKTAFIDAAEIDWRPAPAWTQRADCGAGAPH